MVLDVPKQPKRGAAVVAAASSTGKLEIRAPDPAQVTMHPTAIVIRAIFACNLVLGARYLVWRCTKSLPLEGASPVATGYAYLYLICEVILVVSIWMSHCTRLLPAVRPVIRVDDLVAAAKALADWRKQTAAPKLETRLPGSGCFVNTSGMLPTPIDIAEEARVAILVPTAGEGLPMLLHALLGCFSQKLWEPPTIDGVTLGEREQLRIVVLDERRRGELLQLCTLMYALARHFREAQRAVQQHLAAAKIQQLAPAYTVGAGADEAGGSTDNEEDMPIDMKTARAMAACCLLDVWDKFAMLTTDMPNKNYSGPTAVGRAFKAFLTTMADVQQLVASASPIVGGDTVSFEKVEPGHVSEFLERGDLPALVYHTRENAGQPTISPKAGNLNAAIYDLRPDTGLPLIGEAKAVLVNDARHYLLPNFLQRTMPYLFELAPDGMSYQWGKVCFVQTPQRFKDDGIGDPLANWGTVKFNITNIGKDGAGAVTSCGQGSVWRVDALSGMRADGARLLRRGEAYKRDHPRRGLDFGFRSDTPIEDMVTSLELFKLGWKSAYVLEPDEFLSLCSQAPDTVQWRLRQIYRWHVGGVVTLFQRGLWFLLDPNSGMWPNLWHRVFLFNSLMYYFRGFGALAVMTVPVVYSIFGIFPYETHWPEVVYYLAPYVMTCGLATAIASEWKKTDRKRVFTEMQFFAASAFVEVFSIVQTIIGEVQKRLTFACEKKPVACVNWHSPCPCWPLPATFALEAVAMLSLPNVLSQCCQSNCRVDQPLSSVSSVLRSTVCTEWAPLYAITAYNTHKAARAAKAGEA
ncbi:hypothetical protein JKP88DRAFT_262580 [Tribonema minus]|uniref:Glycosyltransferase 2-like domain-containing protein n=1 Tax=Tribonema minus TaxID=303371 RepID=A0A835Z722_9STRA|nr:hypothetical protein JKP88DRAFT_262580 [Tribonema minus]